MRAPVSELSEEQPVAVAQPANQPNSQHDDDVYRREVSAIRARIAERAPDSRFHIVIERPFVVIGDEAPAVVERRATGTVRWAVERLQRAYFSREPDDIIAIWLFAGQDSYIRHTRALFDETPDTPYGYYSPRHKALIMNIATGGGTLVHEIVHPFMRTNFPECPAWFNEGLGSLYEQSSSRGEHIVGLTNWRLEGLQEMLRLDRVPPFERLMATTDEEFYQEDPGSNYAQARYLLYYLQEHDLLHEYYRRFRANVAADPTGVQALREVLGVDDLDHFFRTWKAFVLELEFSHP